MDNALARHAVEDTHSLERCFFSSGRIASRDRDFSFLDECPGFSAEWLIVFATPLTDANPLLR